MKSATSFLAVALASSCAIAATTTQVKWKSVGGSYSGSFADAEHWEGGKVPGAVDLAYLRIDGSQPAVVTMPEGEYDTLASMRFDLGASSPSMEWNASNTVFRQVAAETDNYMDESFGFRYNNSHFFNFESYTESGADRFTHARCVISNGVARVTKGDSLRLDFDNGLWNFYDPAGVAYPSSYFMAGYNATYKHIEIVVHSNSHLRLPTVQVPAQLAGGGSLRWEFLGGEHEFMGPFNVPSTKQNEKDLKGNVSTAFTFTNGASLYLGDTTKFGAKATMMPADRVYLYDVAGGAKLVFGGTIYNEFCAPSFFTVSDGGLIDMRGSTSHFGGEAATSTVTVAKGGTLKAANLVLGYGKGGRADLVVDGGKADLCDFKLGQNGTGNDYCDARLVVTNGGEIVSSHFYQYRGLAEIAAGTSWANTNECYLGGYKAESRMSVPAGAKFFTRGAFVVGDSAGKATLDVGGEVEFSNFLTIGNAAGATGVVNVAEGASLKHVDGNGGDVIYVGWNGHGEMNVAGGLVSVKSCYIPNDKSASGALNVTGGKLLTTDSFGLGYNGGGEMNVSDGEVEAEYFFLGQGDYGTMDVTLRQTGGSIRCRCKGYRNDVGIKMADGNSARTSRLILDGGKLVTFHVYGVNTRAKGRKGYAALSANGGTIETPYDCPVLIESLDEAKLGAKGLTIKSDYDCGIAQAFADADDAIGLGLLRLAGTGVKTFSATNNSFSKLEVAEGTALFSAADAAQPIAIAGCSVVVNGGAALSLVGEQPSLDVVDLTLGDANGAATLLLDPGDVIRVSGSLTLNSAAIVVSDSFAEGNSYDFIELAGDRAAELADAWSRIRVRNSSADRGYSFKVEYDSESGKTKVSLQVFSASGELGAVSWNGSADSKWATAANWDGGAVPSGSNVAVFASDAAPRAVEVDSVRPAAGLRFGSSNGYVLSGGTILFSALPGVELSASAGSNVVGSALNFSHVNADVADGAAIELAGEAQGDGVVKTGAGRLALGAGTTSLASVTLSNGVVAVAAPTAFANAASVKQFKGLLELGGAEGVDSVWPRVALAAPGLTNAVSVKVTHDATMPAPALSGCLPLPYKLGAGRLTLTSDVDVDVGLSAPIGSIYCQDWYYCKDTKSQPVVTTDADGVPLDSNLLAGLNVAEGELRLLGTAAKADSAHKFKCYNAVGVGVPQLHSTVPAKFTLDHAYFDCVASSRHFIPGCGFTDSNSNLSDVYVALTNGSTLRADTVYVGRGTTRKNMRWHFDVDSSTIYNSYMMHANAAANAPGSLAEYSFRNGSKLLAVRVNFAGRANMDFDASTLAGMNGTSATAIYYKYNVVGATYSGGNLTFRNGSTLRCSSVDVYGWPTEPTRLTFSRSEWTPCADEWTLAVEYPNQLKVIMEDEGMILAPAANQTWTFAHAVTGAGGLVKRGAGKVVFDTHKHIVSGEIVACADRTTTLDFTGTANVEAGTLVVKNGAAAAGAKFAVASGATLDLDGGALSSVSVAGEGTVTNGTFAGSLPVAISDDWQVTTPLTTFASVAFGKVVVDLGRTAENPFVGPYAWCVVGKYSGAAPAVSSWRVANTGRDDLRGEFKAENGQILMRLRQFGTAVIVR